MADEIFIAKEATSQEIKEAVGSVKSATDGIVLSEASIKSVADTILERLGLTSDVGGVLRGYSARQAECFA